eukprot:TRINITY_DN43935_c0_g1_i2.p1 TRINITY_DN43935_c0_g1~~TRINITY_DN43935_c0_g1_i2.p1  ORF type:complete len:104 (+),score=26.02 TRINITY_DN43935_c0_g1_i2:43-312(+)
MCIRDRLDQSVMGVCSFTDISTVYGLHSEGDVTLSGQSSLLVDGTTIQLELTISDSDESVSYTHLRAHETPEHLVCRLLLEKKKHNTRS